MFRKKTIVVEPVILSASVNTTADKPETVDEVEETVNTEIVSTSAEASSDANAMADKPADKPEIKAEAIVEKKEEVKIEPPNNRVGIVKKSVAVQVPMGLPRRPEDMAPRNDVTPKLEMVSGVLEILADGQGYVRPKFLPSNRDAVIAAMQVRRYGLRPGDHVIGVAKAPRESEKYWGVVRIDKINNLELSGAYGRPDFKDLTPIYPEKQIKLEFDQGTISTRIIDLFSPIGFGQRGMIVSPPKAGKTTLLKEIAAGVSANYPNVHLMAVLVGERPEEVTDMQRFIKGEVIASHFDQRPEEQTRAAEVAIERAKRLVELGKDVFIVFDSITRLARAYNLAIPSSGRTLSGGFDPAALYPSKKFFGAARKIENGGSLTIIGTALVDTGSKMDELVFEEFKGTGNMELKLERRLAERRIFPAIDIQRSSTRKDDLLLAPDVLAKVGAMMRMFDTIEDKDQVGQMIVDQMKKTKNNEDFLGKVGKK